MVLADGIREGRVGSADTRGAVEGLFWPFIIPCLEHATGALPQPAGADGLPTPAAITASPSYFGRRLWRLSRRVFLFRHAFVENAVEAGLTAKSSKIMFATSI